MCLYYMYTVYADHIRSTARMFAHAQSKIDTFSARRHKAAMSVCSCDCCVYQKVFGVGQNKGRRVCSIVRGRVLQQTRYLPHRSTMVAREHIRVVDLFAGTSSC